MNRKPFQPQLVTVLAALALYAAAPWATAQTTTAPTEDKAATPSPAAAEPSSPAPSGNYMERTFGDTNPSNSASQSALTPAYELGGIGRRNDVRAETILTAPTVGLPLRMDNGLFVYPSALVGVGRNDNVTGTTSNKISSSIVSLQPAVVGELKKSGDRYTLLYRGNYTRYTNSSADNFDHHELAVAGDNYFDSRNRVGWTAAYLNRTDPRGSTDRGLFSEPDRWNMQTARGLYIYGAQGAMGRIELDGTLNRKRYENNRASTELADFNQIALAGRFYYRVAPRTSALVELRRTSTDYISSLSTNDNVDTRVLTGVTWQATAKTSGTAKIGYVQKNYSAAGHSNASGVTWEAGLRWSPLTYSTIDLIMSKSPVDATGLGDYITNTANTALWNHRWSQTISSRVSLGSVHSVFANAGRTDTTLNTGAGLFYELGRSFRGGLELTRTDRSSNLSIYEFKRNVLFLSLEGTL